MSVGNGRPDRLTSPLGGSERSERGGLFILVGKGRPDRLTSPLGGSKRSERGGCFILGAAGNSPDPGQLQRGMPKIDAGDKPEQVELQPLVARGGHADDATDG